MKCSLFGHKRVLTSVVDCGHGNAWRQFTCARCGMKQQDMTHPWGKNPPTPWAKP